MHHVGIDLAWGERNPTGLAVLAPTDDADDGGPAGLPRLVHLSAVRTDEEIETALAPFVEGPCVVGIDAPLVVVNPTGSRPAEKALSADFRRFDAGTHPSNLGKPELANGPRGGRVAKRLGLDTNPRSGRARRALEVYPHAASVVLFDLPRILRYKAKPGRDLELLRTELLALMTHVEHHVDVGGPDDPWGVLRAQAEAATQKAQLRRVEDPVDAVVCALVARLADVAPGALTIYGDLETGAIVTPRLPTADTGPAAPTRAEVVRAAAATYAERHPGLVDLAETAVARVRGVLDDAGIDFLTVTGRAKSVASFTEKAGRNAPGGRALYGDPLTEITDQVGVRVITYVRDDVDAVADLLAEQVTVTDDRDLGRETADEGRFGYASRHLLIDLAPPGGAAAPVQVQVRTVLQHAWAEFEHDIRYKGSVPTEHVSEFDRRFTLAAGLLELADREFSEIRDRLRGAPPPAVSSPDPAVAGLHARLDPRELAAFLAGQYADAAWSRADHYDWIAGLLAELGVTDLVALGEVLRDVDEQAIAARMDYRHPPGAVRRLDDALLSAFGDAFVTLPGNAHRADALAARSERMRG